MKMFLSLATFIHFFPYCIGSHRRIGIIYLLYHCTSMN
jgi:hypothetical protein